MIPKLYNSNARDVRVPRDAVYIGRRLGSNEHFGNPFSHKPSAGSVVQVGSRAEAIFAFRQWLEGTTWLEVEPTRRAWILANLPLLRGKSLVCYCAPLPCHGRVLLDLANEEPDSELPPC